MAVEVVDLDRFILELRHGCEPALNIPDPRIAQVTGDQHRRFVDESDHRVIVELNSSRCMRDSEIILTCIARTVFRGSIPPRY